MNAQLIAKIERLADARERTQDAIHRITEKRKALDAEISPLVAELKVLQAQEGSEEEALREAAEIEYVATNEKHVAPGVEIKNYTKLTYAKDKAFDWAQANAPFLLTKPQLDVKTFEKVALTSKPEFVTIEQKPQVTIAKDLRAALNTLTVQF